MWRYATARLSFAQSIHTRMVTGAHPASGRWRRSRMLLGCCRQVGVVLADLADRFLDVGVALDELRQAIAELSADSPPKRRFLTRIQQHSPGVTFCWDPEQQAVCLRGIALKQ